jgi:hypothetical protein
MGTSSATAHACSVQEQTNTFVMLVLVLIFFAFRTRRWAVSSTDWRSSSRPLKKTARCRF